MDEIPLHVIHLDQDDPRKCSSRKMHKFDLCELHNNLHRAPKRGILLDPLAGRLIGPDERKIVEKGGALVGLDCSWKQIEYSINHLNKKTKLENRTLPIILAANPVSWGKPGRLSNAEAFAVALILLGRRKQAEKIMKPFKYSEQFFILNKEPLEAYEFAESNKDLANIQWEFFDKPEIQD